MNFTKMFVSYDRDHQDLRDLGESLDQLGLLDHQVHLEYPDEMVLKAYL